MWKKYACLIAAIFVLSSCGEKQNIGYHSLRETGIPSKREVTADFIPRNLKIVAVGDSLTQGVGDSTDSGGYLPYLKGMLEKEKGIRKAHLSNFGIRGTRTDQLLKRLEKDEVKAEIKQADIVLITIGGNDVMKVARENILNLNFDVFAEEKIAYINRLEHIIEILREENREAPIVLIGIYNPFGQLVAEAGELDKIAANWNEAGKAVTEQYRDAYFVDIRDLFQDEETNLLFEDQFHPNDKGYELIAERVYRTLGDEGLPVIAEKTAPEDKESQE